MMFLAPEAESDRSPPPPPPRCWYGQWRAGGRYVVIGRSVPWSEFREKPPIFSAKSNEALPGIRVFGGREWRENIKYLDLGVLDRRPG